MLRFLYAGPQQFAGASGEYLLLENWRDKLAEALAANQPGSNRRHMMIVMPSFSLGETTLSHYAERLPALEHRYLCSVLVAGRIPDCEVLYLCSRSPEPSVMDYLLSLLPEDRRAAVRSQVSVIEVPDASTRSLAQKLMDRPDILAMIRQRIADRIAFIEPWNVTDHEIAVARALGVPINGTSPNLWHLGFKSSCRRIFRAAGVDLPYGHEDLTSLDDVRSAIADIARACPRSPGVVIKHDNSGSGDGNAVIRFDGGPLEDRLARLPDWYVNDLKLGAIAEELISGEDFSSPSTQLDILPDGTVRHLASHEQVMGGPDGQIYQGCLFPARLAYAPKMAASARSVGAVLANAGVVGRFAIDFAAARQADGWRLSALEVNLRKGGTTHPFATLRSLVPGRFDAEHATWHADRGGSRCYHATDNLQDDGWTGLGAERCIAAVREAGLEFDAETGTGVVLHMLSCLQIDGRFGLTAIAATHDEAGRMTDGAIQAMHRLASLKN